MVWGAGIKVVFNQSSFSILSQMADGFILRNEINSHWQKIYTNNVRNNNPMCIGYMRNTHKCMRITWTEKWKKERKKKCSEEECRRN